MKTLSAFCTALAMASASFAAQAAEPVLSKPYSACMDKSGGVTVEMLDCIGAETKRQDARLNTAYKALTAALAPARKTQLLEAQRSWIKFRDTNCGFYFDPEGGTMAQVQASDCFMTATAGRAEELEKLKPQ